NASVPRLHWTITGHSPISDTARSRRRRTSMSPPNLLRASNPRRPGRIPGPSLTRASLASSRARNVSLPSSFTKAGQELLESAPPEVVFEEILIRRDDGRLGNALERAGGHVVEPGARRFLDETVQQPPCFRSPDEEQCLNAALAPDHGGGF